MAPQPIGPTACNLNPAGCPYDSLNISTDTTNGTFAFIGSPVDTNGVLVNYSYFPQPGNSCGGVQPLGVLADDTGCWAGYHPEIQVLANTNSTHHPHGSGP